MVNHDISLANNKGASTTIPKKSHNKTYLNTLITVLLLEILVFVYTLTVVIIVAYYTMMNVSEFTTASNYYTFFCVGAAYALIIAANLERPSVKTVSCFAALALIHLVGVALDSISMYQSWYSRGVYYFVDDVEYDFTIAGKIIACGLLGFKVIILVLISGAGMINFEGYLKLLARMRNPS